MSGIRFKPKYTVLAKSPEIFKTPFTSFRVGKLQSCCIASNTNTINLLNIFNGGSPSLGGSSIKNGGTPSGSGPKIYTGGGTI